MPRMDGIETLQKIKEFNPSLDGHDVGARYHRNRRKIDQMGAYDFIAIESLSPLKHYW
jgi:hypothetical protein